MNAQRGWLILALCLAACGGGGGGSGAPATPDDPTILRDTTAYATAATASLPPATEQAVDTDHTLALAGGTALNYRASIGHLTAGSAPQQASMFYVAYTVTTTASGAAPRPLVFFYNGGPGSASVWLHPGSWAPRRLVTNDLSAKQPLGTAIDRQLADFTGLTATDWLAAPLLGPDPFRSLLKPQQLLGRYDARVTASVGSALAREGDPSSTAINPAFQNAIAARLTELKYQPSAACALSNDAAIKQWTWQHDGNALPEASPDLALALTLKPSLRVMAVLGMHELATPFRQTELDLERLGPGMPAGLQVKRYVGGHMSYLDDTVRPALAADLTTMLKAVTP